MSKMSSNQARERLNQAFEYYLVHNKAQLDALIPVFPWIYLREATGYECEPKGFLPWIHYDYERILKNIIELDTPSPFRSRSTTEDYEHIFERPILKPKFYQYNDNESFDLMVLDRLTALVGLLHHIMVEVNKEPDFDKNYQDYNSKNPSDHFYLETDPTSIKIYKTLKDLRAFVVLVDTIPKYQLKDTNFFVREIDESFPIYEGYIKGVAVQELKSILDDPTLSDKDAVKAVASQLKNKAILGILGKNRQSETEHILKVLSVVLIAVGIGILPTLILATKRLYDTGGTSINFFKPLSQNLCEDAQDITADVKLQH